MLNLATILRASAQKTPGNTALILNDVKISYAQLHGLAQKFAGGLVKLGIKPGQHVALMLPNVPQFPIAYFGSHYAATPVVPLNVLLTPDEIAYHLEDSDAVALVVWEGFYPQAKAGFDRVESCKHLIVAKASPTDFAANEGEINFTALVGTSAPVTELPPTSPDDTAVILYTSGTTGKPKGCMLSNEYFINMGREYNQFGGLCAIDSTDRLMTPLPPNHMNALSTSFMAMLLCGGCVIQMDRFHPRSWWQTVQEEKASVIHYLGVMPAILLTLPPEAGDNFSGQIKFGFGAGSDPRHQQVFEERFGFPLIEAWAMTESGGAGMTAANVEPRHLGQRCIGRPVANMEFRIADAEDQDVPPGSDGELLVRSKGADPRKGFFSGYYKDAEATEQGWAGGWWHTGDVVRQGPDGSLFFVDRQKNVIRRSGENIAAVEVEAALLRHEAVLNSVVTAVPDEMRGDEVFAFVVTAGDIERNDALARAIFDHAMQFLSYFKLPAYIDFVDELPLTASQKISRAEVKRLARERLESGQVVDLRAFKKRPPS